MTPIPSIAPSRRLLSRGGREDVVEIENLSALRRREAHSSPPRGSTRSGRKSPRPTRRRGGGARPPTWYRTRGLSAGHISSPNRPEPDQQGRPSSAEAAESTTRSGCPRHSAMPSRSVSSARGRCALGGGRALSRAPRCGSTTNTITSRVVTRTDPFHGLIMTAVLLARGVHPAPCRGRRGGRHRPARSLCRTVMCPFVSRQLGPRARSPIPSPPEGALALGLGRIPVGRTGSAPRLQAPDLAAPPRAVDLAVVAAPTDARLLS